jgi:hypothetical protein
MDPSAAQAIHLLERYIARQISATACYQDDGQPLQSYCHLILLQPYCSFLEDTLPHTILKHMIDFYSLYFCKYHSDCIFNEILPRSILILIFMRNTQSATLQMPLFCSGESVDKIGIVRNRQYRRIQLAQGCDECLHCLNVQILRHLIKYK